MKSSMKPLWFIVLITMTLAILGLSLTPTPPEIDHEFFGWDKVQHALAYAGLTLAAGRWLDQTEMNPRGIWLLASFYAIGLGGLIEILQGVANTGRSCEWGDFAANSAGALLVLMINYSLKKP